MSQTNQTSRRHCMVVFGRYPLGETRVQREAEALLRRGYHVDVICLRLPGEPTIDNYQGIHIYREPYHVPRPLKDKWGLAGKFLDYIRFFFTARARLNRLHRQHPYDTVQVHNLPDFLVFCASALKARRVPVILDLHDLMPEFFSGRFEHKYKPLLQIIRWQERQACQFADHVITVSEHWRQALIQRGVPQQKCSVVMNVADEHIFHPLAGVPVKATTGAEFKLIYHGTLVYRYGLDIAIKAVAQVRLKIPHIRLILLGRGDYEAALIDLIRQLDLHEHVIIEKMQLAEDLPKIIQTANLGVVPYRDDVFTDGLLPTKLMEYAALGLPAIASRTTAIQTYFSGTMVEFFEPGDVQGLANCIYTLYNQPERLRELAGGSKKFNQCHNWSKSSAEYVALVDQLIAVSLPNQKE